MEEIPDYYKIPDWYAALPWLEIAIEVPKKLRELQRNGFQLHYR